MAGPASSTPAKARVVRWPTGTEDKRTTLSVAKTVPPEPTRALLKDALLPRPASAEQTVGRHRSRESPKDAGMRPASMPSDSEPARCKGPVVLEAPLQRAHAGATLREKSFQRSHADQQLLPHTHKG